MESFTLIDANGNFSEGIQKQLDDEKSQLAVVSIIGAQSSGKSTLLNHMFRTNFAEMDAERGRQRTTNGIWVAKYPLERACILVIDTEGSDGKERGGDETFARQTALFAMAISGVVIINMMCQDVGKLVGGGWQILTTACEAMRKLPVTLHEVTLLFVLRDKTKSPLETLQRQITDDISKILDGLQAQENAPLPQFKIEVRATSHYEYKRREFELEVNELKSWIISQTTSNESTSTSIPTPGRIQTSDFTRYAKKIWEDIKEDKDLDLPSIAIMIARELCDRIANEQCDKFKNDKIWLKIKKNVEKTDVEKTDSILQGFRKKFKKDVGSLIDTYQRQYKEETEYYDKTTRDERGKQLTKQLLEIMEPTHLHLAERMRRKILEKFRNAALVELQKEDSVTGVQVQAGLCTQEFDYQLKEAFIEQAYRTYAPSERDALDREIRSVMDDIKTTNAVIDKQKMDRKSTWIKIAQGISVALSTTAAVAGSALAPPAAPALHSAIPGVSAAIQHLALKMLGL